MVCPVVPSGPLRGVQCLPSSAALSLPRIPHAVSMHQWFFLDSNVPGRVCPVSVSPSGEFQDLYGWHPVSSAEHLRVSSPVDL